MNYLFSKKYSKPELVEWIDQSLLFALKKNLDLGRIKHQQTQFSSVLLIDKTDFKDVFCDVIDHLQTGLPWVAHWEGDDFKVAKVAVWTVTERFLGHHLSRKQREKFLTLAFEKYEKTVTPESPNPWLYHYYDYTFASDLIDVVADQISAGDTVRINRSYNPAVWMHNETVSLDELQSHVAVIVPGARFDRRYWYQVLGRKRPGYRLEDLLQVLGAIGNSRHPKMVKLWESADYATIDALTTLRVVLNQSA